MIKEIVGICEHDVIQTDIVNLNDIMFIRICLRMDVKENQTVSLFGFNKSTAIL